MRRLLLATVSIFAVAACGVDQPTLVIDSKNICGQKQGITTDQQAGTGMAEKTLSLTFDDGPSEVTSEISAYLKNEGIKATFFINGVHVEGREDVVEQQVADGHLLGNHTHTHQALTSLAATDIVEEVAQTDKLLTALVPEGKLYFRAPFGDWNGNVHKALAGSPMGKYKGPVGWDVGDQLTATTAADWDCWDEQNGTRTVQECGDLYLKEIRTKTKGIVLLHDGPPGTNGDKTAEMLRYIVPLLKKDGYKFARIDDVSLANGDTPIGNEANDKGKTNGPPVDPCR